MSHTLPVWLLDLTVNGRLERFATVGGVLPVTAAGAVLPYRGGLQPIALDLAADEGGGELSTPITISADWLQGIGPGGWARLAAAFHRLEGAEAVLRRWTPGTVWDAARVILRGFAEEVEISGPAEPLIFTLRRNLFSGSGPILDPRAKVDDTTWTRTTGAGIGIDEKYRGAQYPRIYGYPGEDRTTAGAAFGIPAASSRVVVGQFRGATDAADQMVVADGPIEAANVRIFNYSDKPPTAEDFAIQTVDDNLGRAISIVDFVGAVAVLPVAGAEYWAGFGQAVNRGGGKLRSDGRAGVIRGLGEVIADLMSSAGIDFAEIDPRLDAWLIDTWINEPDLGPWEWISRELAPICPFRVVEGRLGLGLRLFDWEAQPRDAVRRFDVDRGDLDRASSLRFRAASSIVNRAVVEYKRDRLASYTARWTLGADRVVGDEDRSGGSLRAAWSQQRLTLSGSRRDDGIREKVYQTAAVWEPATAQLVARYKLAQLALPVGEVTYRGPVGLENDLDPCDPILISDSEIGLVDRVLLVERITPRPTDTLISGVVLEDPATLERRLL